MRPRDQQLRDHLAAEYVLGTLHGRARRRFERWLEDDRELDAAVAAWAARLFPLAQALPPVAPSARVWGAISTRIGAVQTPATARTRWWDNIGFWRSLAATAASLVVVLAVLLALPGREQGPAEGHMVMVANRQAEPLWVVSASGQQNRFKVKTLRPAGMAPEKVCVLWLIWPDGYAAPLGELPERIGSIDVRMPKGLARDPMRAQVAVSVESAGAPVTAPSRELVFKGPWVSL
ncbi:MAG: hypothetical protein AMS22_01085 [Thiotrichales bacterium SG8_50]|nr:MAG: hypothetical protein AMS22_01085 [Thiotrichales bacterium SG8_50]